MPPPMGGRRRDAEGGRGRLLRHPISNRLRQREPSCRSELGITVHDHPGPPLSRVLEQTHSLWRGPDDFSDVHNVCRQVS